MRNAGKEKENSTTDNNRFFGWNNAGTDVTNAFYFEGVNTAEQSFVDSVTAVTYAFSGTTLGSTTPAIYSLWENTSATTIYGMYNYVLGSTTTSTSYTAAWIELGGTNSVKNFYQWIRMRSVPPSGVMPSVTFGSVQQVIVTTITLYLNGVSNANATITYGTESNFTAVMTPSTDYVSLYVNGTKVALETPLR